MLESDDLVYKLIVSNMSDMPIVYKITFAEEADSEVNLSWPRNGIKGSVAASESTTVALLAKMRPDEGAPGSRFELEKLKTSITWKSDLEKLEQEERMRASTSSAVAEVGQSGGAAAATVGSGPQDWEAVYTDPSEKNCGACTMLNPMSATSCFVCGTPF
mmetsp:Transcript_2758/g.3781  ORF Transcript_2758/g.3781 Transcript_2758/m.3781 type:complete len:160 (+) Transcript_2758:2342-2821(+)